MVRIGEFARLAQVSVRALRYYEGESLLVPAYIDPRSRYRYYELHQLAVLARLLLLKEVGLSLKTIRSLLTVSRQELRSAIERHSAVLRHQLEAHQLMIARSEALSAWLTELGSGAHEG